jgi:DUF971 family protein
MPGSPQTTPFRLNLRKTEGLEIHWSDGVVGRYSLTLLRTMCPCAACRAIRERSTPAEKPKSRSLTVLPGNFTGAPTVVSADLVGNYALKITWSDGHDTGIYSYTYLRSIMPKE